MRTELMIDLRHQRAMQFTSMMMQIVSKHVRNFVDDYAEGVANRHSHDVMRDIAYELEELCKREGVEIITDGVRAEAGLPPRGPNGLTVEELLALEKRRLDLMMAPTVIRMPSETVEAAAGQSRHGR